MSVRFKFRSAVHFDSVDIGDRPSISVRELRAKIIQQKNLNLCHDFDLVFSDPLSGREYEDESYQIPSNSSVMIKRVPARSAPSALPIDVVENLEIKKSDFLQEKSGEMDDFDDFGIDLCAVPEDIFPFSSLEPDKKNVCDSGKANIADSRSGCQKFQASDLVEGFLRGSDHNGTNGKFSSKKLEPKSEEHVKRGRTVDPHALASQNVVLPSELRCPICNNYFKEAVMIPCCQHSFCERCIRGVLIEKAECPKCSSNKFKAENLLPNLSLRQAIEHFLESQNHFSISENALRKFAPDEESGIQGKDLSSAVTVVQKRLKYPLSSSATEKRSNHLVGESFYDKNLAPDHVLKASLINNKVIGGESKRYAHDMGSQNGLGNQPVAEFEGENEPLSLPQNHGQEKGGERKFSATARYSKVGRTCYSCGAPDHLIRDCPFANGPHPTLQTGNSMYAGGMASYGSPYWNNTAFGPMSPFSAMYVNPGMMAFNPSMYPFSSIGGSPYVSSMYGHIPATGGIPGMVGMAPPVGNILENPSIHPEVLDTRNCAIGVNYSTEYMMRRKPCDDEDDTRMEKSGSDKRTQRSRGKEHHDEVHSVREQRGKNCHSSNGARDRKACHAERSNSGVENMTNSSDKYDGERYNHHHHRTSRKHREIREHSGSDCSRYRCREEKDKDAKRRVYSNEKSYIQKHGSQFGSVEEPSSCDRKKRCKEGDHSLGSRHSRDGTKYTGNELCCRSKMVRRDEDRREDYHQSKRKRIF